MIKKLFLVIAFLGVGLFTPLMAQEEISMQVILKGASGSGPTYTPPRPWYITQYDYTQGAEGSGTFAPRNLFFDYFVN